MLNQAGLVPNHPFLPQTQPLALDYQPNLQITICTIFKLRLADDSPALLRKQPAHPSWLLILEVHAKELISDMKIITRFASDD